VTTRPLHAETPRSGAAELAIKLLQSLDTRVEHSAAVAKQIGRVADLVEPDWRCPLQDAAWLHDVGYSPYLVLTGFHPLGGARWLRDHGWAAETCRLVAWHTESLAEARLSCLEDELIAEFDTPPRLPAAALAWADLTSSPNGEVWDPAKRVAEILDRYSAGSLVHEATRSSWPALRAAVSEIEDLLESR
jgi:hypothetical protein